VKTTVISFILLVILSFSCLGFDAPEDILIETDEYIFRLCNNGDQIGIIGIEPKDPAITPWLVRAYTLRIDEEAPLAPQMVFFTSGSFEDGRLTITTSRGGTFSYIPETKASSTVLAYNLAASAQAEKDVARRISGLQKAYRNKRAYLLASGFLVIAGAGAIFMLVRRSRKA
jgi:hypothetical protein